MNPRNFLLALTFLIAASACNTVAPTATPKLLPSSTPTIPTATASPTDLASLTAVPATPTLGTPVAYSDSASLVADVTYPDNSQVDAGKTFIKTWRLKNTGTCAWNANYTLVFSSGSQRNSPTSIPFQTTPPGWTIDLSVTLVGPVSAGTFTGIYQMNDASGEPVLIDNYKYLWVKVVVSGSPVAQAGVSSTALIPVTGATGTPTTSGACTYTDNPGLVSQIYTLINAARASNGLPALTVNPKLVASATAHSIDMACHSLLSHTGSDGSTIQSRITAVGYSYSYWNEAIFAQPPQYGGDAAAAVNWWLNDPPHRLILLTD
jgi:uncharacterized protein YkwD